MTPDHRDQDRSEDELGPDDERAVQRLLAASGGPVTMPDHVASRLDEVLAGLQADRADDAPQSADAPATGSGRRRRWPAVLVAAATVAVVAAGLGNVLGGGGDSMSASTADKAVSGGGAELAPQDNAAGGDAAGARQAPDLPEMHTGSATLDAQRIYALRPGPAAAAENGTCELPAVSHGERLVAVRFDGERATLLFGPERRGHREAQVYSCDDSTSPVLVTAVRSP
ncbi:MAG TPA: hypothetical protein VFG63_02240 [Nocardioidaceae bacterium]|nr:hypothetical protein [Nocardioidaceae bacterium]